MKDCVLCRQNRRDCQGSDKTIRGFWKIKISTTKGGHVIKKMQKGGLW